MWVNKNWSMKQLHLEVFIFIRQLFAEWLRMNEEGNEKCPEFPFHPSPDVRMTKAQFMALDHEKAFDLCFPGLSEGQTTRADGDFEIGKFPYVLSFKSMRNYSSYRCYFCDEQTCYDCPVPYNEKWVVSDILKVLKIEDNDNMFNNGQYHRSEDFQINLIWNQQLEPCGLLGLIINVKHFPNVD